MLVGVVQAYYNMGHLFAFTLVHTLCGVYNVLQHLASCALTYSEVRNALLFVRK